MPSLAPQSSQRQRRFRWAAAAVIVMLTIGLYEVAAQSGYLARREQLNQINGLNQQIQQLQQENQRLSQKIQRLRSDPGAIEELAREQLHLGRPGEVVVTLPPPQPDALTAR